LLTASLAPISNQNVPSLQGLTLPLDGTGTTDPQTFTVTSSNPNLPATIADGEFWTINVTYSNPSSPSTNFSGPLTFQLLGNPNVSSTTPGNFTPNTAGKIEQFTTDGFYSNSGNPSTGKKGIWIPRIAPGFPGTSDYIIQGGATTSTSTGGSSGEPGTPFSNENVQPLAFTGTDQLAMANAGGTNTNDTQWFITTGSPNFVLGYGYTIFGQLVPNPTSETSAQTLLSKLVTLNPNGTNNNVTTGNTPAPTFTASLSTTNPSGVVTIDASQATPGATTTITVTATDTITHDSTSQAFQVTVVPYAGPTTITNLSSLNFKPFANPTTATTSTNTATTVTLKGQGTFPVSGQNQALSYTLVSQPAHGTVTKFDATKGTLTYTPQPGFMGTDTFQYTVTSSGPNTTFPAATSNPGTVSITVSQAAPVHTGAVRLVGNVLLITPLPRPLNHGTNYIDVIQVPGTGTSTTPVIHVYVNNQLDTTQPSVFITDSEGTSRRLSIIAFGSKANDVITIDPSVTVPWSVIDGGHGGVNRLKGGSAETREHGWFGHTILIGGSGPNQLIGRAGQVRFRPTKSTDLIYAGEPRRRTQLLFATPPGGTFYIYKKGRLIPVPATTFHVGSPPRLFL
jgi:cyclophilin family peptidyl-prolyl cis-trans isomerase